MGSFLEKALSAVGLEVESSTTVTPDSVVTTRPSLPAPIPAPPQAAVAATASDEVTQEEAERARNQALVFAEYASYDVLPRYMVMEAKSKVEDASARAQAVLEALKDAADVSPDAVIAQAKRAADKLRAQLVVRDRVAAAAVTENETARADEAKSLQAAIAADEAQIQQIQARMQRAKNDLAGLDSKYAAMNSAAAREHDIFVHVSNLLLSKWDILVSMNPKAKS